MKQCDLFDFSMISSQTCLSNANFLKASLLEETFKFKNFSSRNYIVLIENSCELYYCRHVDRGAIEGPLLLLLRLSSIKNPGCSAVLLGLNFCVQNISST